jgi:hypothetical protein
LLFGAVDDVSATARDEGHRRDSLVGAFGAARCGPDGGMWRSIAAWGGDSGVKERGREGATKSL